MAFRRPCPCQQSRESAQETVAPAGSDRRLDLRCCCRSCGFGAETTTFVKLSRVAGIPGITSVTGRPSFLRFGVRFSLD